MNVETQKELDSAVKTYQKRQQQINKVFLKPIELGSVIGKPDGNPNGLEYYSSKELMEVNRHIMRGMKTIPIPTYDCNSIRFAQLVARQARKANPNKQYALKLEHHITPKKYRLTIIGQPSYFLLFSSNQNIKIRENKTQDNYKFRYNIIKPLKELYTNIHLRYSNYQNDIGGVNE